MICSYRHLQTSSSTLHGLDGVGGGSLVGSDTGVLVGVTVHLHQLGKIELGLLEHLDLADEDVLKRRDGLAALLDLSSDGVRR